MAPRLAPAPQAFACLLPSPELFFGHAPHRPVGLSSNSTGGAESTLTDRTRAPSTCSHRSLYFFFKSLVPVCNSLLAIIHIPTQL